VLRLRSYDNQHSERERHRKVVTVVRLVVEVVVVEAEEETVPVVVSF
jgi:hypothetical protein